MKQQKTYYGRIKKYIVLSVLISQLFMFFTISTSYILFKHMRSRDMLSALSQSYEQSLNSLTAKIDNTLYMFETSGAISFVGRYPSYFDSEREMSERYNKICRFLDYSELNNRYFSSYYIIGNSHSPLSLVKKNGSFSAPTALSFDYSFIFQHLDSNEFVKNYQKLFYLDKTACDNIKVPEKYRAAFDLFLDELDGKLIYTTLRNNAFCVLVINESIFDDIFTVADNYSVSVLLKSSDDTILYQNKIGGKAASEFSNLRSKISIFCDRYDLTLTPHGFISFWDILFFLISFVLCCTVVLYAVYHSEYYASKIMNPYRIITNFFRLTKDIDAFSSSFYHNSVHTRSGMNKLFLDTFIHTIIIPSLLALSLQSALFYGYTLNIFQRDIDSVHQNTITEMQNMFDTFIIQSVINNQEDPKSFSRSAYTLKLNHNLLVESVPFSDKNYSFSKLNTQLRQLRPYLKNGTLVSLHSDIFGDPAIAILRTADNNSYTLNVIKSRELTNVKTPFPIYYVLTDSENSILAQSSSGSIKNIHSVIEKNSSRLIKKYVFPEYNWTLCTFADIEQINSQIFNTCLLDGLVITLMLLVMLIIAWLNAISIMRPFENIINSMSKSSFSKIEQTDAAQSEIEELISVYNNMLTRIQHMTEETIRLAAEKEQLTLLKIQTEMNVLQHQINPHFLYNTLNMISLNAASFNADTLSNITSALSDIFRYSTNVSNNDTFLGNEFENLDNYIYIWSMRFPERFKIDKDIDPDTEMIPSLKLILQPIVENCFMHAFDNMEDNCRIQIKSYTDDNNVIISIKDNGQGLSEEDLNNLRNRTNDTSLPLTGRGIGMRNVYQRLKLAYGSNFDFIIESTEGQGTTITIKYDISTDT